MFSFILILALQIERGVKKEWGYPKRKVGGVRSLKKVGGNKGDKKGMGERGGMIQFCR